MCVRKQYPIGEFLLTSLLTFSVFSIRLNPWNNRRMYESNLKNLKELVLLEQFVQFSASSFTSTIKGHKQSKTTNLLCGKSYELCILCRISSFSTRISPKLIEANFKKLAVVHSGVVILYAVGSEGGAQKIKLESFHPPPPSFSQ